MENKLKLIVGCDANAHHVVWGITNIKPRGEIMWQYMLGEELIVANIESKPIFFTAVCKGDIRHNHVTINHHTLHNLKSAIL